MVKFIKNKNEYVLDKKDRKILDVIANNGRMPHLKISKLTRISKDSVRERLNRLEREKYIITYAPFIDYSFLGCKVYHIYVKINPAHNAEKEIDLLRKNPNVISTVFTFGKYDLGIQVLAKSRKDAMSKVLPQLSKAKACVLSSGEYDVYSANKSKPAKMKKKYTIDELDLKILKELSRDARKSIVDIAHDVNSTVEVVRYRLNTMLDKKVITGINTRINKNKIGLNMYIFLMNIKKGTKVKRIFNLDNVFYAKNTTGPFNYVINFHAKDNAQLASTVKYIRQTLADDLNSFELLNLMGWTKFDPLPRDFDMNS